MLKRKPWRGARFVLAALALLPARLSSAGEGLPELGNGGYMRVKSTDGQPVVLPIESVVELRTLDPAKRPLRGYIDGVDQGEVRSMKARVSNIAAVELAFDPRFDASEKLARLQFPPAPEPPGP